MYLLVMMVLKASLARISGNGGLERSGDIRMTGMTKFFFRTLGTCSVL